MTKYIKKVSQQVPITMTLESLQELFYPIGSIVQSATLDTQDKVKAIYGGNTWEKIRGRFLLGQSTGDGFAIGSQGGQKRVTLTVDEMPSHEGHLLSNEGYGIEGTERYFWNNDKTNEVTKYGRGPITLSRGNELYFDGCNRGSGQAHENMPPFEVVYIWKRTA